MGEQIAVEWIEKAIDKIFKDEKEIDTVLLRDRIETELLLAYKKGKNDNT